MRRSRIGSIRTGGAFRKFRPKVFDHFLPGRREDSAPDGSNQSLDAGRGFPRQACPISLIGVLEADRSIHAHVRARCTSLGEQARVVHCLDLVQADVDTESELEEPESMYGAHFEMAVIHVLN